MQVYSWTIIAAVILIISIFVAKRKSIKEGKEYVDGFYPILDLNKWWSLVLFFTFCGLALLTGYYGNTAFIYGKF